MEEEALPTTAWDTSVGVFSGCAWNAAKTPERLCVMTGFPTMIRIRRA